MLIGCAQWCINGPRKCTHAPAPASQQALVHVCVATAPRARRAVSVRALPRPGEPAPGSHQRDQGPASRSSERPSTPLRGGALGAHAQQGGARPRLVAHRTAVRHRVPGGPVGGREPGAHATRGRAAAQGGTPGQQSMRAARGRSTNRSGSVDTSPSRSGTGSRSGGGSQGKRTAASANGRPLSPLGTAQREEAIQRVQVDVNILGLTSAIHALAQRQQSTPAPRRSGSAHLHSLHEERGRPRSSVDEMQSPRPQARPAHGSAHLRSLREERERQRSSDDERQSPRPAQRHSRAPQGPAADETDEEEYDDQQQEVKEPVFVSVLRAWLPVVAAHMGAGVASMRLASPDDEEEFWKDVDQCQEKPPRPNSTFHSRTMQTCVAVFREASKASGGATGLPPAVQWQLRLALLQLESCLCGAHLPIAVAAAYANGSAAVRQMSLWELLAHPLLGAAVAVLVACDAQAVQAQHRWNQTHQLVARQNRMEEALQLFRSYRA